GDELRGRSRFEIDGGRSFRRSVDDAIDTAMFLVAQRRDVSGPLAGRETGRRWIVLDDVVVPVEYPHRAIGTDLGRDGGRPFVGAGQQIETIVCDEVAALFVEFAHGHEMAGRLGDEGHAVPVRLRKLSRRVDGVTGGSGETIVVIYLTDRRYRMNVPVVGHADRAFAE